MLSGIKSIYIIGIGGVSMSALALMLKDRGIIVKGSDIHLSEMTAKLASQGIEVVEGEAPFFVDECDAVLYTGAIGENNSDFVYAQKLGKPLFSRAEILGMFSCEKKTISISGTHGKTTTTGMISTILLEGGYDPTIHIGGELKSIKSNLHIGQSDIFITEACEYKDAFLSLKSHISVVLNIEEDHLDYFKNFDNIISSFNKFIQNTDENGFVVYNYDNCQEKLKNLKSKKTISFGLNKCADLRAENIFEYKKGRFCFDAFWKSQFVGQFQLSAIGRHNIYNALASIAVCLALGVDRAKISSGLLNFQGVGRRMEIIREENPFVIHDYAHHPQEIEASLNAIKSLGENKIICIFQPHTFSRTKALYGQFLKCFLHCEEVWLLPIYPAREKSIKFVNSQNLSKDLRKNHIKSRFFRKFSSCKKEIAKKQYQNYTFAVLGAGNIEELAKLIKSQYSQNLD